MRTSADGVEQAHSQSATSRTVRDCLARRLPEQRAIAAALSDVDALLGGLDRLIAKKRDLKQAAMQQLLTGQTRLPGFHGEWEVSAWGCDQRDDAGGSVDSVEDYVRRLLMAGSSLMTSAVAGARLIDARVIMRIAVARICAVRVLSPLQGDVSHAPIRTHRDLVGECGYVDRDSPTSCARDQPVHGDSTRRDATKQPMCSRTC